MNALINPGLFGPITVSAATAAERARMLLDRSPVPPQALDSMDPLRVLNDVIADTDDAAERIESAHRQWEDAEERAEEAENDADGWKEEVDSLNDTIKIICVSLDLLPGADRMRIEEAIKALKDKATNAAPAVAELVATQKETLRMLEAAHRQLGMWTGGNPRISRAREAIKALEGGAA